MWKCQGGNPSTLESSYKELPKYIEGNHSQEIEEEMKSLDSCFTLVPKEVPETDCSKLSVDLVINKSEKDDNITLKFPGNNVQTHYRPPENNGFFEAQIMNLPVKPDMDEGKRRGTQSKSDVILDLKDHNAKKICEKRPNVNSLPKNDSVENTQNRLNQYKACENPSTVSSGDPSAAKQTFASSTEPHRETLLPPKDIVLNASEKSPVRTKKDNTIASLSQSKYPSSSIAKKTSPISSRSNGKSSSGNNNYERQRIDLRSSDSFGKNNPDTIVIRNIHKESKVRIHKKPKEDTDFKTNGSSTRKKKDSRAEKFERKESKLRLHRKPRNKETSYVMHTATHNSQVSKPKSSKLKQSTHYETTENFLKDPSFDTASKNYSSDQSIKTPNYRIEHRESKNDNPLNEDEEILVVPHEISLDLGEKSQTGKCASTIDQREETPQIVHEQQTRESSVPCPCYITEGFTLSHIFDCETREPEEIQLGSESFASPSKSYHEEVETVNHDAHLEGVHTDIGGDKFHGPNDNETQQNNCSHVRQKQKLNQTQHEIDSPSRGNLETKNRMVSIGGIKRRVSTHGAAGNSEGKHVPVCKENGVFRSLLKNRKNSFVPNKQSNRQDVSNRSRFIRFKRTDSTKHSNLDTKSRNVNVDARDDDKILADSSSFQETHIESRSSTGEAGITERRTSEESRNETKDSVSNPATSVCARNNVKEEDKNGNSDASLSRTFSGPNDQSYENNERLKNLILAKSMVRMSRCQPPRNETICNDAFQDLNETESNERHNTNWMDMIHMNKQTNLSTYMSNGFDNDLINMENINNMKVPTKNNKKLIRNEVLDIVVNGVNIERSDSQIHTDHSPRQRYVDGEIVNPPHGTDQILKNVSFHDKDEFAVYVPDNGDSSSFGPIPSNHLRMYRAFPAKGNKRHSGSNATRSHTVGRSHQQDPPGQLHALHYLHSSYPPSSRNHDSQIDKSNLEFANAAVSYNEFGDAKDVLRFIGYSHEPILENKYSVIIKVEASTVSRVDCEMRKNVFSKVTPLPFSPGIDCIGIVHRMGEKAPKYGISVGDRVATMSPYLGGNARYVSVHVEDLVLVPHNVDVFEAVCILRSYVTAQQCLYRTSDRKFRKGDKVLVTGANGSVGRAVMQLAFLGGASDVFAVADERHRAMIERFGAIHVPFSSNGFRRVPGLKKIDIIIDTVGGKILQLCCEHLHPKRGRLISVGMVSNVTTPGVFGMPFSVFVDKALAHWKSEELYKYDLFRNWKFHKKETMDDIEFLFHLLERRQIEPHISKIVSLQGVADAQEEIEFGGINGYIVCDPWKKLNKYDKRMQSQRDEYKKLETQEFVEVTCMNSGLMNKLARIVNV